MNDILFYCIIFLLGASFGSFYFTLYLRYLDTERFGSMKQILSYSSACPFCGIKIGYLFLFPVLGYFFSIGRCRACRKKISVFYPLTELICGILLTVMWAGYQKKPVSVFFFLIFISSVTISFIDFKRKIIPNLLVFMTFIFALTVNLLERKFPDPFYGMLFMFLVFGLILLVFPGGFGGGDLKYASVIGFILGFELSVIAFEISILTGALIGSLYGLISAKGLKIKIPFAPFLTTGFLISFFFGWRILIMYYNIFKGV